MLVELDLLKTAQRPGQRRGGRCCSSCEGRVFEKQVRRFAMSTMELEDALNMGVSASGAVWTVAGGGSLPYLWLRFFSPETPGGAAAPLLVWKATTTDTLSSLCPRSHI